ncbi:flavin reductase family protein [Nocardia blacklockiae]|uniref:flavin reductase family protein n=1 Tax=Nocardia blacklockiae TaxID=480036 RepID=UPI001895A3FF|nr:flavin reductase family protein [Nocardia blacklockiae]MBF6170955.1 flavin reductase [Nocardia blacklockiae]
MSSSSESAAERFDAFVAHADYPMLVVTTRAGEQRAGCLVGFATQSSIAPRRFLACVSKANHTHRIATGATHLAVHLTDRRHPELARLFGTRTGDDIDKFARCDWDEGPHGLPILRAAANWFTGAIVERHDLGDHTGFLLDPDAAADAGAADPLRFTDVADLRPGHDA